MRLWTIHPKYLDSRGLVALWREALLARKVLRGKTRGYRNHPQLDRFRAQVDSIAAINGYLHEVHAEALRRGYRFDKSKLRPLRTVRRIAETRGQVRYEWLHLKRKLRGRAPLAFKKIARLRFPNVHPLFRVIPGNVRVWEHVI